MPNDPDHGTFEAHQDFTYNLGSTNSITIWIPFQSVHANKGCLRIVPASHRSGVFAHEKGILTDRASLAFADVPMRLGEILVFNQFLVHKSGKNVSDDIRFSLQIRVNDLSNAGYVRRQYYYNHEHRMLGNGPPEACAAILSADDEPAGKAKSAS